MRNRGDGMKVFFDMEFTGLHQNTTPISIGCVCEGSTSSFYGEFTDYDANQVDDWIRDNVLAKLRYGRKHRDPEQVWHEGAFSNDIRVSGNKEAVGSALDMWLYRLHQVDGQPIEIWSDCLAYDWVLFCELFGGALYIPKFIYYIPFDLATLFRVKGIDPDISREEYIGYRNTSHKHDAINDAVAICLCYQKAMTA